MSDIDDCRKFVENLTRDRGGVMRAGDDKIAEIRARHESNSRAKVAFHFAGTAWAAHDDRDFLLAEDARHRAQIERLRAENERLRAEIERTHALLKDPNAVTINMLRGVIALPSADQVRHIYQQTLEVKP